MAEFNLDIEKLSKFEAKENDKGGEGDDKKGGGANDIKNQSSIETDDNNNTIIDQNGVNNNKDRDDDVGNTRNSGNDDNVIEIEEEVKTQINSILEKEESERTEEENKLLEDNKKYVDSLNDSDNSVMGEIIALEGYITDKKYEDSVNGLEEYLKDRDAVRDKNIAASVLTKYPEVYSLFEHLSKGNPITTFLKSVNRPDILNIELKELSSDTKDEEKTNILTTYEKVISENLKSKGIGDKFIEPILKEAREKGNLFELAKESQEEYKKTYNKQLEEENLKELNRKKLEEEENKKMSAAILSTLESNDFGNGISIPKADIPLFKEYITIPVDNTGRTKADERYDKATIQEKMLLDYLLFKNFKGIFTTRTSNNTTFLKSKKDNDSRERVNGGASNRNISGSLSELRNLFQNQKN